MKKGRISAADLMRDLSRDAEYQRKIADRDASGRATLDQEQLLLQELARLGVRGASLAEVVEANAPISGQLAGVLVGLLKREDLTRMHESIVRSLGTAGESFDAAPLIELFEATPSASLRWAISNTLAELRPLKLGAWLEQAFKNRSYGDARQMLALAIGRALPPATARRVLRDAYDEFPGHVSMALAECGGMEEITFLRSKMPATTGWARSEVERALRAIEKRETGGGPQRGQA